MAPFVNYMHSLELAVHPYTFADDHLYYTSSAVDEAQLYVDKGVDGLFCEFPHSTFNLFSLMGSKADFPTSELSAFLQI